MNGKPDITIVTEVQTIEIDGRFFHDIFEAEKYLVQEQGMSVSGARRRVKKIVNQTLDAPQDASRRIFLQKTGSFTLTSMVQGLGLIVEGNCAQNLWTDLLEGAKFHLRKQYMAGFCWGPINSPVMMGAFRDGDNHSKFLQNLILQSSILDHDQLDKEIIRCIPTAFQSAFPGVALSSGAPLNVPVPGAGSLTTFGNFSFSIFSISIHHKDQGRTVLFKNGVDLESIVKSFYDIVDANDVLLNLVGGFHSQFPQFHPFLGQFPAPIRVFGSGPRNMLVQCVEQISSFWGNTYTGNDDGASALVFLSKQKSFITAFLKKHPEFVHEKMNYRDVLEKEHESIQREMSCYERDDNWYHGREIMIGLESKKQSNAQKIERVIDGGSPTTKLYSLETILHAFEGLEKIAQLFGLR